MKRLALFTLALLCVFVVQGKVMILENRIYQTIAGNGTTGNGSDGNNYPTGISVTGSTTKTIQVSRSGLSNISASFEDLQGAGSSDGNNYTLNCSVSGTNTKTVNCARNYLENYSYSFSDIDTDSNYYTMECSVLGTSSKTAYCSRQDIGNYTFSWTDLDTDDQTCAEVSGCVVGALTAETDPRWTGNSTLVCYSNGTNCPAGGGGFSANQSVNTSSAVTFSGLNITATDAALQFNSSGLRWMLQVQDSGANLKFIDVQGSVILALNKDSDTTTAKNAIGEASYAGANALTAKAAASQTANIFEVTSSSGSDYVTVNGTGALNSSVGTFIDAKNCDTVDTDASGRLSCGTDANGGSSAQTFNISLQHSLSTDTTNYANYSNNTINLAANKAAFIECNIFTNQTANTIATHYRIGHSGTSFYQDQGQHWTSATALANCAGTGSSGYTTCAAATAGHGTGAQTYTVYSAVVTGASGGRVWVEYKAEAAGTVMILSGSTCEVDIT